MSSETPRHGLFSSLSLGRASRVAKPPSETLTHPLLGASTSSLNLNDGAGSATTTQNAEAGPSQPAPPNVRHTSSSRNVSGSGDVLNVPYKPRQRGGHGSTSSISSIIATAPSPALAPNPSAASPVTPTGLTAPRTTSAAASTTTTFASPSSATDNTSVSVADTSIGSGNVAGSSSATSRLQLQSLKAAAQKIGLGNGSMGMSMIDAIFEKGQNWKGKGTDTGDWAEVLKVLSGSKAILLLPTSPASTLPTTAQLLKDHIAFVSPPIPLSGPTTLRDKDQSDFGRTEIAGGTASVVVTLSGLVGTLRGSAVSFESTLAPDSPLHQALKEPSSRANALSALRPTNIAASLSSSPFPTFILSSDTAALTFPPLGKGGSSPASDGKEKDRAVSGKLGRINPFASFFGSGSSPALGSSPSGQTGSISPSPSKVSFETLTPERPLSPVGDRPTSPSPSSPKPSFLSVDADASSIRSDGTSQYPEGYLVVAYTVSKSIRQIEVNKALNKALKATIRDELHRLPDKVIERVIKLVTFGACPTYSTSSDSKIDPTPVIQLDFADPTSTGERLQDFMEGVYDDLVTHFRADSSHLFSETTDTGSMIRRKASWTRKSSTVEGLSQENDSEEAKKERKERLRRERDAMVEKEASEGTEKVEGVVCRLLYNRLFSPLESDDSRHDEALASRIAALNMLDLSLDHLGLITRPENAPPGEEGLIANGLAKVVDRIGDELQKLSLPNCLTPKEKGDVLIKAHTLVVDGLAELPPIDLRPEGETYVPAPQAPSTSEVKPPLASEEMVRSVSSKSSGDGISSPASSNPPTAKPITASAARRNSSAGSTPLSSSPVSADPLAAISELMERTPLALQSSTSLVNVPELVLPDGTESTDTTEASKIEEAMSDSVITISEKPRRDPSPASQISEKSKPKTSTSGADLILPIIIFAVVKSNPPQLASQLMYLRRYRSAICLTGEASYAIVNLTAVVEFLEHVHLAELGLGDESGKVMSVEDLSPIGLNYLDDSNADAASIASASSRLRGRVFQVGELAGSAADSANKVFTGVVDSSWTALRGLISSPNPNAEEGDGTVPVPNAGTRPGMRPRQASTFSLASVTASVATIAAAAANRSRSRANSRASAIANAAAPSAGEHTWKGNEEMVEVSSRPGSIREKGQPSDYPSEDEEDDKHTEDEDEAEDEAEEVSSQLADEKQGHERTKSDTRSIKSVSSALSRNRSREPDDGRERVSISDRLASIGVLGRLSTPEPDVAAQNKTGFLANLTSGRSTSVTQGGGHGRRLSLLGGSRDAPSPANSVTSLPLPAAHPNHAQAELIEPPLEQFMLGELGDIRLSEIGALLRDYRRLGHIINTLNAKAQQQAATAPLPPPS